MQIQQLKNNGRKFTLTPQVLLWSRCWDLILMFLSAYICISARSNWFLLITNFDVWHITQLEIVLAAHFLMYAFHFCYHLTFFCFFFSSVQNICLKKYQIMKKQLDVVPRLLFYTCTFFSLLKSNSSTIIQLWFISHRCRKVSQTRNYNLLSLHFSMGIFSFNSPVTEQIMLPPKCS